VQNKSEKIELLFSADRPQAHLMRQLYRAYPAYFFHSIE